MKGCEEEPLRLGSQEVNRGVHPLVRSKLEETGWTHSNQDPGGLALDSRGSHAVDLSSLLLLRKTPTWGSISSV